MNLELFMYLRLKDDPECEECAKAEGLKMLKIIANNIRIDSEKNLKPEN